MSTIKTVLIDDEPLALALLKKHLNQYPQIEIIGTCLNGYEALPIILDQKPDLLFLDIQMPKINGFELLELAGPDYPNVIFVTAFDEFAIKAFEFHAADYILKPYTEQRLKAVLEHFIDTYSSNSITPSPTTTPSPTSTPSTTTSHISENPSTKKPSPSPSQIQNNYNLLSDQSRNSDFLTKIVVRSGSSIHILPTHTIDYLESHDDYVKINVPGDVHLKLQTMNYYEKALDPAHFVRIHRSIIVNIQSITRLLQNESGSHQAMLKNGTHLPISKAGYLRLKEVLSL